MDKERSRSYHLFDKESVFKKTLRNASNTSRFKYKLPFNNTNSTFIVPNNKEEITDKPQVDKNKSPVKAIIRELRKDLLFIPHNYLDEPPNPKLNASFVSFNELHQKQPQLFPDLNYVSIKELQAVEEKKKKEENMSYLDKFFRDLKRGSHVSRNSVLINFDNFRELNQVMKELAHNVSQKQLYEKAMDKINIESNEIIFENYKKSHKRMPPIKIYSTQTEKYDRMKQTNALNRMKTMKETNYSINYKEAFSNSKISIYKYENINGIKPMACEGSTLTVVDDKAYLIGGRGIGFKSEIACFKLSKKKWKFLKSKPKVISQKEQGFALRMNHSTNIYKNSIIVFGGEKEFNNNVKARQCLSDVEIYNIENNDWETLFCKGDTPEARKNHISILLGNQILIHGGLNSFSKCLKDAIILDLFKSQWLSCESILELPALSGHAATFVSENEKKYTSFFFPRIDFIRNNNSFSYIKEEGLYIFGGKNHNNQCTNNLMVIKTGSTPFKIVKPEQKGSPPPPRYNHAMKFCKYLNCIIIYGGRNDELKQCFSDIYFLNLESFSWIKLNLTDNRYNESKFSFGYDIYNTRMLIFGGMNFDGFINNDLYVIEFDDSSQKRKNLEEKVEIVSSLEKQKVRKPTQYRTYLPIPVSEEK